VWYNIAEQCKQLFDTSIQRDTLAVGGPFAASFSMLPYDIIFHMKTKNGFGVWRGLRTVKTLK